MRRFSTEGIGLGSFQSLGLKIISSITGPDNRAQAPAGWKSSIGLPAGSSNRICWPPGPLTMSLRNVRPAAPSRWTSAAMSLTIRWMRALFGQALRDLRTDAFVAAAGAGFDHRWAGSVKSLLIS